MAVKKTSRIALSDLELTVLGIVWKKSPCTAYAIMREFSTSPSSHYRGSAGAIYPLVRRLKEMGHIKSSAGMRGRRPHVTYAISSQGLAALRKWLRPPLPDSTAAITIDPLRTRVFFLAALPPDQRLAFAVDAGKRLREQLEVVKREAVRYREVGDGFSALATEGAICIIRARVAWITTLEEHLSTSLDR